MRNPNRRADAIRAVGQNRLMRRIEQLETRCLLNAASIEPAFSGLMRAPVGDDYGMPDNRGYQAAGFDSARGPGGQFDSMEGAAYGLRNSYDSFGPTIDQRSMQSAGMMETQTDGGNYTIVFVEMVPIAPAHEAASHSNVATGASLIAPLAGPKPGGQNIDVPANFIAPKPIVSAEVATVQNSEAAGRLAVTSTSAIFGVRTANEAVLSGVGSLAISPKQNSALAARAKVGDELVGLQIDVRHSGENGLQSNSKNHIAPISQQLANGAYVEGTLEKSASAESMPKAALAVVGLDVEKVEQAIAKVMKEVGQMGFDVANWLDEAHLTPLTAAVGAVAAGGGTAYYLRRRSGKLSAALGDEELSSWHFARMQPVPKRQ